MKQHQDHMTLTLRCCWHITHRRNPNLNQCACHEKIEMEPTSTKCNFRWHDVSKGMAVHPIQCHAYEFSTNHRTRKSHVCKSYCMINSLIVTEKAFWNHQRKLDPTCKICSVSALHVIFPEMLEVYALVIIIMLVNIVDRWYFSADCRQRNKNKEKKEQGLHKPHLSESWKPSY